AGEFAEVSRAGRPGARFRLLDEMRVGEGDLPVPQPWAITPDASCVETPDAYQDALAHAGFDVLRVEDRRPALAASGGPRQEGLVVVFGDDFAARLANSVAATRAGLLALVLVLARACAPQRPGATRPRA